MSNNESPAVARARAHLEAWTNHDHGKARTNLAEDVQFVSPAATLSGIKDYMDAPRGLAQFANAGGSRRPSDRRGEGR
ncbi:MAG TPA: hypothetical protein VFR68_08170 [Candidatus Dormibacteraeota bacterium]|nr:hypothetical protein [Candidatus Dormibacteraeota bacterium]